MNLVFRKELVPMQQKPTPRATWRAAYHRTPTDTAMRASVAYQANGPAALAAMPYALRRWVRLTHRVPTLADRACLLYLIPKDWWEEYVRPTRGNRT